MDIEIHSNIDDHRNTNVNGIEKICRQEISMYNFDIHLQ